MKHLLSRILADPSKSTDDCLDDNIGAAYVEGFLTEAEKSVVDLHLAECARCRLALLFAAVPERPVLQTAPAYSEAIEADTASRHVSVKLAVLDALGAVQAFFEETVAVLLLRRQPVMRGPGSVDGAPEGLAVGPCRLTVRFATEGSEAGLAVRVMSSAGVPLPDASAEVELEGGERLRSRTDSSGWARIAGASFEQIRAIRVDAAV